MSYPRVTDIIKAAGAMPDYEHWDPTGRAMNRGSAIDSGCRLLFQGCRVADLDDTTNGFDEIKPYLISLELWLDETKLEPGIIQADLSDPILRFQGHPDWYNPEWVIDTKAAVKAKWHKLQTAAYQYLTRSKRRGSLYLQANGSMAKLDPHEDRSDWGCFLSMLKLWWGNKELDVYRENIKNWMEK